MLRAIATACFLSVFSATALAQPNIVSPGARCPQLEAAWKLIMDELYKGNYVQVLARAYVENRIITRKDGAEITIADTEEYIKEVSAYDSSHYVFIVVGDIMRALEEKKCTYENKGYAWDLTPAEAKKRGRRH
jgi:hypothetical protein